MPQPFGDADCESEVRRLQEDYRNLYFFHTRYNHEALNPEVYLIIGRRGAGKTALAQSFSFQARYPGGIAIYIDQPAANQHVLAKLAESNLKSRVISIPSIGKIWEYIVWSVVFEELKEHDERIAKACIFGFGTDRSGISVFIHDLLKALLDKVLSSKADLLGELETLLRNPHFVAAQAAVVRVARHNPLVIAFDTLENYDTTDQALMHASAALIDFASDFSKKYTDKKIFLKVFLMAEVFPHLKESVVLNPLKSVRDEIYLHWRPRDLMRLISWRLLHYLQRHHQPFEAPPVDWEDYRSVKKKVWDAYFGEELRNGRGLTEKTFPYVLRHTQMRPRQLILLCNAIAKRANASGEFPKFSPQAIVSGVRDCEASLAEEVLNAYGSVYQHAARIVEALSGMPPLFKGNDLDKRAPSTASYWPAGEYSPASFRQLVGELGVVGRVRSHDDEGGYAEADFEYSASGRLPLLVTDECVIHPMFYRKLNVQSPTLRVLPFPDHDDYKDLSHV